MSKKDLRIKYKNNYTLGVDVGSKYIGFAILDTSKVLNKNYQSIGGALNKGAELIYCDIETFEAKNAKANKDRREFRHTRRNIRRQRQRLDDIKLFFEKMGLKEFNFLNNPYQLRYEGLSRKLNINELFTVCYAMAKRRGVYDDNISMEDEDGKIAEIIKENKNEMLENNFEFPIQYQIKKLNEKDHRVLGSDNYFSQKDYEKELKKILDNSDLEKNTQEEILNLVYRYRKYFEGPGSEKSPTKYGCYSLNEKGKVEYTGMINKMRGSCGFNPDEYRAPKMSYSSYVSDLLDTLNNITLNRDETKITTEEKLIILEKVKNDGEFTFSQLKKMLKLNENDFSGMSKYELPKYLGYKELAKIFKKNGLEGYEKKLTPELIDYLSEVLTTYKSKEKRRNIFDGKLTDENIPEINLLSFDIWENIKEILISATGFSGYASYSFNSFKYFRNIQINYNENTSAITYNQRQSNLIASLNESTKNIPYLTQTNITNPIVLKSLNITIRTINRLRQMFGEFENIIIEMPRSKDDAQEKLERDKFIKKNQSEREDAINLLNEFDLTVNEPNILKVRLWKEQGQKDIYTGKELGINDVIVRCEVDHILPKSVSFNNSINNKVLTLKEINNRKSNSTPYYSLSKEEFKEMTNLLKTLNKTYPKSKAKNLLMTDDLDKYENRMKFTARTLVDTQFIAKELLSNIKTFIKFKGIKTNVLTIRGVQTSFYRKMMERIDNKDLENAIKEKSRKYVYNHIIDAYIIALVGTLDLRSNFLLKSKFNSNFDLDIDNINNGEDNTLFEKETRQNMLISFLRQNENMRYLTNLEDFDLNVHFNNNAVLKTNGQLFDQTLYSIRKDEKGNYYSVIRKPLNDPKILDCFKNYENSNEEKNSSGLLIEKTMPETFDFLYSIYKTYKTDDKKRIPQNPFEYYSKEIIKDEIRVPSKKGKGTPIKYLKFIYSNSLKSFVPISNTNNFLTSRKTGGFISPYNAFIRLYRNSDGTLSSMPIKFIDLKNGFLRKDIEEQLKIKNKITGIFEKDLKMQGNYMVYFDDGSKELLTLTSARDKKITFKKIFEQSGKAIEKNIKHIIDIK